MMSLRWTVSSVNILDTAEYSVQKKKKEKKKTIFLTEIIFSSPEPKAQDDQAIVITCHPLLVGLCPHL